MRWIFRSKKKLSFVLPVTLKEKRNGKWRYDADHYAMIRLRLLLHSFVQHFKLADLDLFLIICPKDQIEPIRQLLFEVTIDSRFHVVSEEDICPNVHLDAQGNPIEGWYIQQILKIAAAEFVKTPFYITLDSDIICRKPFDYDSLITRGKSLINIEDQKLYARLYNADFYAKEIKIKKLRFKCAAEVLGYDRSARLNTSFYGETPVVFNSMSMRGMCAYLSDKSNTSWFDLLKSKRGWTEITLYFLYLELQNTLSKYHQCSHHNKVLDLERSVWHKSERYNDVRLYSPEAMLGKQVEGGIFIAIQSWIEPEEWLSSTHFVDFPTYYAALEQQLKE